MVSFRFTIARALLTAMATPASSEQPPRMVGDVTVSHAGRAERLRGACLTGTSLAGRWCSSSCAKTPPKPEHPIEAVWGGLAPQETRPNGGHDIESLIRHSSQ